VLKTAVTRSGMDAPGPAMTGLTPAAKALFVAAAAHAQPNGAVLYVVPGDGDLEENLRRRLVFSSPPSKD